MAEEHRCQAPEGHHLCANNCGFFGSPATMNLCSKCYKDFCLKEQQQASIKSTVEASLSASSSSSVSAPPFSTPPPSSPAIEMICQAPPALTSPEVAGDSVGDTAGDRRPPQVAALVASQPNRCSVCRKRVGLTGFKCRCGTTYCGIHRYPEKHACSFDFKKLGREEIARSNPLVIAEKLEKI